MDVTPLQLLAGMDGWQALAVAIKALLYAACLVACGGIFFLALFSSFLNERERQATNLLIMRASLAGMLLSVSGIFAMNGMLSGAWSDVFNMEMTRAILSTRFGLAIGLRLAGLGLVALLCSPRMRGLSFVIPLVGAALAIFSIGLAGHANELSDEIGQLPLLLIVLHLLAIAFWLGALWPLYLVARNMDIERVAATMRRFSKVALIVVSMLIAAGLLLLWQLLGSAHALWTSTYGQLMLGKLAGVALLLLLASLNKLMWTPKLLAGDRSALRLLRRSIFAEMVVAGLILLITAGITTTMGPPVLN